MNYRRRLFVASFLGEANGNATAAARAAGYKQPSMAGSRMLKFDEVRAAIDAKLAEAAMPAAEVLARLSEQAAADVGDFLAVDADGSVTVDLEKARLAERTRLIRKLRVVRKTRGDVREDRVEVELHDSQAALAMLARHHGLLDRKDAARAGQPTYEDWLDMLDADGLSIPGLDAELESLGA